MLQRSSGSGVFAGIVLLSLLTSAARAQVRYGDIAVTVPENPFQGYHGYAEYRIQVSNLSSEQPHEVRLSLPRESYGYGTSGWATLGRISRTVTVPAASTLIVNLAQPALPLPGDNQLGVVIDGVEQRDGVPLVVQHASRSPYAYAYALAVSRDADLFEVRLKRHQDLTKSRPSTTSTAITSTVVNQLPANRSQWSPNWLAYSGQDAVVLTAWDLQSAPVEARKALFEYTEAGGLLVVLGKAPVPSYWLKRSKSLPGSVSYAAGFGRCLLISEKAYDDWAPLDWDGFFGSLGKTADPHLKWGSFDPVAEFPVAGNLKVPIRGLFLLMILFVVAIGPVNVFLVSRINKRVWLWWTVPVISLATTAAVAGYTVFSEGFRSHRRSETLTVLNEADHQASTIGLTAFYCTLTPSGGLRFDRRTELTPIFLSGSFDGWRTIDWTEGQQLDSGWVRARIPAYFFVRKSEARRERLVLRQSADGSISALNGLGAPILRVWYASPQGTLYHLEGIKAGEEQKLTALKLSVPLEPRHYLLQRFYLREDPIEKLVANPDQYLSAGSYIAELQGSPFLESGLESPKSSQLRSIVFGIGLEAPRP